MLSWTMLFTESAQSGCTTLDACWRFTITVRPRGLGYVLQSLWAVIKCVPSLVWRSGWHYVCHSAPG